MKNNTSLVYNFCLVLGDGLAIIVAFVAAYILRVSLSHQVLSAQVHARDYVIALLSLLPFWLLIFALLGLYNSQNYDKRFSEFGRLVIGAFIGDWLLPRAGVQLGVGMVGLIVDATIGAIVLLLILRLVAGGGGFRSRWGTGGRRW